MKQYIRKIAYLFHYRNGIKGESVGYAKLSVRNGQGSLTVRLRPCRDSIEEMHLCTLSDSGQAEELGLIYKKEGVLEGVYLYENDTLDKLLALSGLFLLDEEEYYGARMDGRDLTEQMVRGALSAHVQAFAEEFAKAVKDTTGEEIPLVFPVQDSLYAAELVAATTEEQTDESKKKEREIEEPEREERKIEEPEREERRVEEPQQAKVVQQETPQKELDNIGSRMWTERQEFEEQEGKEQLREELSAEMQYELLLKKFPAYRPVEGTALLQSVRLEPSHIRNFPREARKLAENSFLLHSFYQYKHLVLAKKQAGEQIEYLLLVPGVFHYRDIYLASTFGFSSFLPMREECRRRQKKQGEFGYWYLALT